MSNDDDDREDTPYPAASTERDSMTNGAAADSATAADPRLNGLPRLLRYAMLANDNADRVTERLAAEIDALCPDLPSNVAWAVAPKTGTGLALAAELDHLAVTRNLPLLRTLGDCVRLLSLPLPCDLGHFADFRRVTRAMIMAFDRSARGLAEEQRRDLERFIYGWAALPTSACDTARQWPAVTDAAYLGDQMARYRIRAAVEDATRRLRPVEHQPETNGPPPVRPENVTVPDPSVIALHRVVVGRLDQTEIRSPKLKGLIEPVQAVINTALPLVTTPPLDRVRTSLIAEFPYAAAVIDVVLGDLIGRPTIRVRPLLLVGEPGAGKSRFARRLGEALGLTIWRTDAAQADGSAFAGTDRRWHSAECCHPLLAIARGKTANPLILLDELDKAGTRNDYGRLWDCLLGLLEPETASRYPDPALQIPLDLSHISYVATVNVFDPLPSPLRDRFRISPFPKPSMADLDALWPGLTQSLAAERGVDSRWIAPLDATERATIAAAWPGGSVRRLRRIIEAILHTRDHCSPRH